MHITLEDMLSAKEQRQQRQQSMREKYGSAIVSITINLPGPVKDSPVVRQLCDYAVHSVAAAFNVLAVDRVNLRTGPEAILAVAGEASAIKHACIGIEEQYPFARLLDLDVFAPDGRQLSRQHSGASRACLLCAEPAIICMRERRHSIEAIRAAVQQLLNQFQAFQTRNISPFSDRIGALATEAMLFEVTCTPAPGLVDRNNSGAHRDMDFYAFMASTAALSFFMARCCEAGVRHRGALPALLPILRLIGLEGEAAMLAATKGVNTQKGLLFSLGVLVAAAGWLHASRLPITAPVVLETAANIVTGIVEQELGQLAARPAEGLTAGERLYRDYGVRGIRGEMADGLPAVKDKALPALRQALKHGLSVNDALVHTLLVLISTVEDTTVMNRHSPEKLYNQVRPLAAEFIKSGGMYSHDGLQRAAALDELFIKDNISPGGAADLLAVTWFLHRLTEET